MDNSFSAHLPELWNRIGTHGVMTLSTCSDERVTSRPMSVVVIGGKFYCRTDENYLKCRQLRKNPNAALCHNNFSIEGKCRIIGRPYEHEAFIEAMKKHYGSAVERWSSLPSECVLEITPSLIYSWDYEDSKPYMEYWDFEDISYRKEWK
ncbi:MAG: pyridoxamine 5'-phosphate oxidase family protein [Oscillospiraceae bacterium]|nr:pyridoxamine 5'-phosphate oxidase family protein [Oscillospiraceae bacterium]